MITLQRRFGKGRARLRALAFAAAAACALVIATAVSAAAAEGAPGTRPGEPVPTETAKTQDPTQHAQPTAPLAATIANPTFAVVVGESRVLPVRELVRVAVADPSIADVVVVSKTEVIVNGKAEGRTTLHVWDASGRSSHNVRVYVDNADLVREIEETIGVSGVVARFARSTLLLDGAVETDADSERAERIARAYADKVVNLLTVRQPALPPQPPAVNASEVQAAIGVQGIAVRVLKDTVILEGQVESPVDADRAERIARIFADSVLNFVTLTQPVQPPVTRGDDIRGSAGAASEAAAPSQQEGARHAAQSVDHPGAVFGAGADGSLQTEAPVPAQAGAEPGSPGRDGAGEPAGPRAQGPPSMTSSEQDADQELRDVLAAAIRDPAVEVTVVKGTALLEGLVASEYAKLRAETVARLYSPKVVSIIQVKEPQPAAEPASAQSRQQQQQDQSQLPQALQPLHPAQAAEQTQTLRASQAPGEPGVSQAPAARPAPASEHAAGHAGADAARSSPVLPQAPGQPASEQAVQPEPRLEDKVSEYMGVPTVKVRSVDGRLLLEGNVPSQSELERVTKIASMFSEDVVNLVEMTDPVQVLLQVNVVEVNRNSMKELGVTWGGVNGERIEPGSFVFGEVNLPPLPPLPTDIATWDAWRQVLPYGSPVSELWRLSPIRAILDLLVSQDAAEVLAAPSLLTLSGKQADFLVGGEIPVYVGQSDGKIVFEWRPYGIRLTMLPTVDARGRVAISMQPEVSSLDWNNALDVGEAIIPALKVRRASTHLVVEDGATIAIGGLLQTTDVKVAKKVPLLGDIPIIGSLFKSEGFERGETELVILITPHVVKTSEVVTREMIAEPVPMPTRESAPAAAAGPGE